MAARLQAFVLLAGWGAAALGPSAMAQGDRSPERAPAPRPLAPDAGVAEWIAALSSDSYADRKRATQRLMAAGAAAIAPVAAAADSDDLELPARCIAILKRLSDSEDARTKQAALSALRELARSSRTDLARHADEALRPPIAAFNPRVRIQGVVRVWIAQPVRGAPERTLVREFRFEDNGRVVQLRHENRSERGSTIVVRVIEPRVGKDRVTEYKADSVTELREQHPDAYALYAKHSRELYRQPPRHVADNPPAPVPAGIPLGDARIQVQVVPVRPDAVPAAPAEPALPRGFDQERFRKPMEARQAAEIPPRRAADAREEEFRRVIDLRRRMEDQRELMRRQFEQLEQQRRAALLEKQLRETSARLRALAEEGDIRRDDLRRLAEELERMAAHGPSATSEAVPAPRPGAGRPPAGR